MLHRFRPLGARRGAVLNYTIDRDAVASLRSLTFVCATDDYWELVDWCRNGKSSHHARGYYDLVYGPVARDVERHVIYEEYDQVSFHTAVSVTILGTPTTSFVP
jgi:hypothetical protein